MVIDACRLPAELLRNSSESETFGANKINAVYAQEYIAKQARDFNQQIVGKLLPRMVLMIRTKAEKKQDYFKALAQQRGYLSPSVARRMHKAKVACAKERELAKRIKRILDKYQTFEKVMVLQLPTETHLNQPAIELKNLSGV